MGSKPAAMSFGPGVCISGQSIYEQSSTPKHRIGERLQLGQRVFYYAKAGANITAGRLCESAALLGASTTAQATITIAAAANAGAKDVYVTATTTAQAAGLYDEGWMAIEDVSVTYGVYLYHIRHNEALPTSGSGKVTLYDELHIALTTSDKATLMVNPFKNVQTAAAKGSEVGVIVGVAPISVTSDYYFWLQTWGPCAIFSHDGGLTMGVAHGRSGTTGGDLGKVLVELTGGTATNQIVGIPFYTVADEDAGIILLQIMP